MLILFYCPSFIEIHPAYNLCSVSGGTRGLPARSKCLGVLGACAPLSGANLPPRLGRFCRRGAIETRDPERLKCTYGGHESRTERAVKAQRRKVVQHVDGCGM